MSKCKPGCDCFKCRSAASNAALEVARERARKYFAARNPVVPALPPSMPQQSSFTYWMSGAFPGAAGMQSAWSVTGNPMAVTSGGTGGPPGSVQQSCSGPASELALGSVFAWRRYRFDPYLRCLTGARRQPWAEGRMRAFCLEGCLQAVPNLNCTCGIYAFNAPNIVGSSIMYDGSGPCVDTVVECWGTTLIGDKGIRTANARIIAGAVDQITLTTLWGRLPLEVVHSLLGARYPNVPFYTTSEQMLQLHPLSTILTEETPDGD